MPYVSCLLPVGSVVARAMALAGHGNAQCLKQRFPGGGTPAKQMYVRRTCPITPSNDL